MDGRTDGRTDGRRDRQMDGWTKGRKDGRKNEMKRRKIEEGISWKMQGSKFLQKADIFDDAV